VYISKNLALDANGKTLIGYGPISSDGQNRAIQEITFGTNTTLAKDPTWGALNLMFQYSYLQRNPWYAAVGAPSNASLSMGQELAVTPLQMICAHSALANGGTWISPRLVLGFARNSADRQPDLGVSTAVIGKATNHRAARWLIEEPMAEVVRRGTGTRAQIDGYNVFGKTGTAQKLDPETGTYSPTKYVGSFLCGAPASAPRVVVLVVVDEPTTEGSHYGGTVAAPAAAEILRQTLVHLQVRPGDVRDASAAK